MAWDAWKPCALVIRTTSTSDDEQSCAASVVVLGVFPATFLEQCSRAASEGSQRYVIVKWSDRLFRTVMCETCIQEN